MSRRVFLLAVVAALVCAVLAAYVLLLSFPTFRFIAILPPDLGAALAPAPAPQESTTTPRAPVALPPTLATVQAASLPAGPTVAELEAAAATLRAALVNIICTAPQGSGIHSISASGIIVSPSGYVLTNAHVAEYFLLSGRGISCTLRTGDPARVAYKAELAYLPAKWMS